MHMTMGKKVVLLNLDNIYESLYDVLNQVNFNIILKIYMSLGSATCTYSNAGVENY